MNRIFLYGWVCLLIGGCSRGGQSSAAPNSPGIPAGGSPATTDTTLVVYAPVAVKKTVVKRVFVHLMPWFETKETNAGAWGQHWTMANQNPDIIDGTGRRQIASHYYPLIGPYASGDSNVIEYQLLTMKLSGIDGVLIDWPGTTNLYDYPKNAANAEKIISMLGKVGLAYAMVYEDQNINIAYGKGVVTDKIAAARQDMDYLQTHHFGSANYERVNGAPLLLDFGPQTFTDASDWAAIFSVLAKPAAFFTLWGDSGEAGSSTTGEFAWINQDNLVSLNQFYGNGYAGTKIASAYPGFNSFYAQGGWGGPGWVIDAGTTGTSASGTAASGSPNNFKTTLGLALQSSANTIQLPTWNDYGEGTMIEPTVEFRYGLLTSLQVALGMNVDTTVLASVDRLYRLRLSHGGQAAVQEKLNQAFYYMVSLQTGKAADLLNSIN
jgi:hypothetical protein